MSRGWGAMQRQILRRLDELGDGRYVPLSWCELAAFELPETPSASVSFRRAARGLAEAGLVETKLVPLPPLRQSTSTYYRENRGRSLRSELVQGPRRRLVIRKTPTREDLADYTNVRTQMNNALRAGNQWGREYFNWYWTSPTGIHLDEIIQDYEDGVEPWE